MNTKRKFSRRKIKNNVFSRSTYRKQKKKKKKKRKRSFDINLFVLHIYLYVDETIDFMTFFLLVYLFSNFTLDLIINRSIGENEKNFSVRF